MFNNSNFNKDISKWDVSNATNMSYIFNNSKFNLDISNWFNKINNKCKLKHFGILNNIEINSYDNFKQYHRQMILNKL